MRTCGFTVLELMSTLAITSILLSLAIPSGQQLLRHQTKTAVTNQMTGLLHYARETAISSGHNTGICPTSDSINCGKTWGRSFIVYKDLDNNKSFDPDQGEALQIATFDNRWSVNWRAFNSTDQIRFQPSGHTFNQNGTMEICPPFATESVNTLVLNRIGRLRKSERKFDDSHCG